LPKRRSGIDIGARLEMFEGGQYFMIQHRSTSPTIIEFSRGAP
jgi:hypothetical protein